MDMTDKKKLHLCMYTKNNKSVRKIKTTESKNKSRLK